MSCPPEEKPHWHAKRVGKWGLVLFIAHLLVHEIPMLAIGGTVLFGSCHSHESE